MLFDAFLPWLPALGARHLRWPPSRARPRAWVQTGSSITRTTISRTAIGPSRGRDGRSRPGPYSGRRRTWRIRLQGTDLALRVLGAAALPSRFALLVGPVLNRSGQL